MMIKNVKLIFVGMVLMGLSWKCFSQRTVETNIPYAVQGQSIFYNSLLHNQNGFSSDSWNCGSVQNNLNYNFFGMGLSPSNGFMNPAFGSIYGGSCQSFAADYNIPLTQAGSLTRPIGENDVTISPPRNLADIRSDIRNGTFTTEGLDPNLFNPNIVNSYVSGNGSGRTCPISTDSGPVRNTSPGPDDGTRGGTSPSPDDRTPEREILSLTEELGPQPRWQEGMYLEGRVPIRDPDGNEREAGYELYGDGSHNYGLERTRWNIEAAGRILAEQDIVMGVGHLSKPTGRTTSHSEHQGGKDVDLRLIPPRDESGVAWARPCTTSQSDCFDVDNTFQMIKAFIDVDPYGIDRVYVNSRELRVKVNEYLRDTYGIAYDPSKEGTSSPRGNPNISTACPGHSDHVHLSFKNNGPSPDDLMDQARGRE